MSTFRVFPPSYTAGCVLQHGFFTRCVPTVIHGYDSDEIRMLVKDGRGDALWPVILGSSRESYTYQVALSALLSSDHDQRLLYALGDRSAIEGVLNVLDLVSVTHVRIPSAHADYRNLSTRRSPR